ncbi:hypothetical protein OUZ56_018360 [Daphnia magna]|uniref:Uncharacterized protein n=1 Tax=Daphnia magna TaxID=35525 RepID=A0ABQ9Z8L8_9CRUS|nr:hypothetical protein OUZ56_018360 [Daphnia magna]
MKKLAEFDDWCDEKERNKSPAGNDELLTLRPISSQQMIRSQEKSSSSTKANVTSTNGLERFSVTPSRTMRTGEEIRGYLTNKTISDSRQPFGEISEPLTLPISSVELSRYYLLKSCLNEA